MLHVQMHMIERSRSSSGASSYSRKQLQKKSRRGRNSKQRAMSDASSTVMTTLGSSSSGATDEDDNSLSLQSWQSSDGMRRSPKSLQVGHKTLGPISRAISYLRYRSNNGHCEKKTLHLDDSESEGENSDDEETPRLGDVFQRSLNRCDALNLPDLRLQREESAVVICEESDDEEKEKEEQNVLSHSMIFCSGHMYTAQVPISAVQQTRKDPDGAGARALLYEAQLRHSLSRSSRDGLRNVPEEQTYRHCNFDKVSDDSVLSIVE